MKKLFSLFVALAATIFLFNACGKRTSETNTQDDFLAQWIDTSVSPGDDFFRYATGNWMKNNPIPDAERRWGVANLVQDEIYEKLLNINREAAADEKAPAGSNRERIGAFWTSGMDSTTIDSLGIAPLQPELERIDAIKTTNDLLKVIARHQVIGGSPLFSMAPYQDEMNSEKVTLHLYQGGIGLPDRDYYFNTDSRTKTIRGEYQQHLSRMFMLMGDDGMKANINAAAVMKLETSLAKVSRKLEDLRDPYANYNKSSVSEFTSKAPVLNFGAILAEMGLSKVDTVIIGQPEFFAFADKSLKSVSMDDWKAYLRWNLVSSFSGQLSKAIDEENFRFYGTALTGVKVQRPRWKRILNEEEGFIGDALGQLYVEKYVSKNMKKRYQDLVTAMMETYSEHIHDLDWMTAETKVKAQDKLSKVTSKVCYPDKWKDYSSLELSRTAYLENVIKCRQWQFDYYTAKLFKPVDRTEWDMTPQTYNAYYNPSNNEIVLPAAIFLIPNLPDSLADDAIIYGYAAASTIGHEITHGFDDQGRQFDPAGNLSNWWMNEDSARFAVKANMLIEQFNNYVVLDSIHVNGEATLGENIADLGGIVIGLDAFKKTAQYKKGEKIDGLTPVQRYFLGYAMGWLGHARDASLANQIMTDVHAPNFLRVNGPFSNIPEFYEAFGIKEGDKMWRPDSLRVVIW
jgi:putative endopeptidase